jgi:hypothetical protein
MKPTDKEHECFTKLDNGSIPAGRDVDVYRIDDKTIFVSFPNGGHIRIVSETPIKTFCKPE